MTYETNDETRGRFLAALARRGMLGEDGLTIWGEPAWRHIAAGSEPQALDNATVAQRNVVVRAHATPALAGEHCAGWVEAVFASCGLRLYAGDARELYERYCHGGNAARLLTGMIVAVPAAPYTPGAARFGHVGLYIGDDQVMDCANAQVRKLPLDLWLSNYGVQAQPRWGWYGGVALA